MDVALRRATVGPAGHGSQIAREVSNLASRRHSPPLSPSPADSEARSPEPGPPPVAARATAEDARDFNGLHERYFSFTWRALTHLGVDASGLDDAAQELWLAAYCGLPRFEGRSTVRTWLFGIALNVARRHRRRAARGGLLEPLPETLASAAATPEQASQGRQALTLLHRYLESLDELRRSIFVSFLLEGLSAQETAQAVGESAETVYHRVRALRRSFERYVEKQR